MTLALCVIASNPADAQLRVMRNGVASGEGQENSGVLATDEAVQNALPLARKLQCLPNDYTDPAVGLLGRIKRRIKRKLVNTFKHYYVDVLSRQQSQVNTQLVAAVQQLAECCTTLDLAARGLQRRIDQLETQLNDAALPQHDAAPSDPILEDAA